MGYVDVPRGQPPTNDYYDYHNLIRIIYFFLPLRMLIAKM